MLRYNVSNAKSNATIHCQQNSDKTEHLQNISPQNAS